MEKSVKNNTPNFFIVGAPKCGTTSLCYYLSQHPHIFFAPKEIHFFGKDLKIKNQLSNFTTYLNFFNNQQQKCKGDASVWYLYSKLAPLEIKEEIGQVKIIICLRNPVNMIYSLHGENLYNADETEKDFEKALLLEYPRKTGSKIPSSARFTQCLFYKENGLYSSHIERWQATFGKENVHFVFVDDLKHNALQVVNETLRFLKLSELSALSDKIQNEAKKYTSLNLHQKIKSAKEWEKTIVRFLIPFKTLREKLITSIYSANIKPAEKQEMSATTRKQLQEFFTNDIKKTAQLTNKNLNHWLH